MKYLFFDIECSNGFVEKSKICSFGYVLTNSDLNVIKEEDIFINPSGEFNLVDRKCKADIKLKYPEEFFRKQEQFPYYYETIKNLLEDPDTNVIGFATENDVRYILTELLFYELEPINFKYYDIQEIFDDQFEFADHISLSNASELLGMEKQDDEHDSLSDARMTMNVCKKVSTELNTTLKELLSKYEKSEFKDYRLLDETDEPIRKITGFRLYKYYINQPGVEIPFVNGKTFCFSRRLENANPERLLNLYKKLTDAGGIYNLKVSECNFFVSTDEANETDVRYQAAKHNKVPVIPYTKFLNKIGITNEELDSMDPLENMIKRVQKNSWVENKIYMINERKQNKEEASSSLGDMFADFFKDFKK